jgi:hypothetical protein
LLDGVEQWFGPAAIDLGVWLWLPQQVVEIEKPVLVLSCGHTVTRPP